MDLRIHAVTMKENVSAKKTLKGSIAMLAKVDSLDFQIAQVRFWNKNQSARWFWIIPECGCDKEGSEDSNCDKNGHCKCKTNINGDKCDFCKVGYFGFPVCEGNSYKSNIYQLILILPSSMWMQHKWICWLKLWKRWKLQL